MCNLASDFTSHPAVLGVGLGAMVVGGAIALGGYLASTPARGAVVDPTPRETSPAPPSAVPTDLWVRAPQWREAGALAAAAPPVTGVPLFATTF
jgi:hypothetical protein